VVWTLVWVASDDEVTDLKSVPLEVLPASEASVNVVPPFELITFARLPTEKHDAAVAHGRKIDQSLRIVFQLHAEALQLSGPQRQFNQEPGVLRTSSHSPAPVFGTFGRAFRRRSKRYQTTV